MIVDSRHYRQFDRREVIRITLRDPTATLLEACPLEEFEEKHLPGARRIDFWDGREQVAGTVGGKGTMVIVYCQGEPPLNAERAASLLSDLGYQRIAIYAGGKADWERGGLVFEGRASRQQPGPRSRSTLLRTLPALLAGA